MRRAMALVAFLLAVAMPASGSFIEDTLAPTTLKYQEDGGILGDAPETCELVDPARQATLDDIRATGLLVDHDEQADAYAFVLETQHIGTRVQMDLIKGLLVDRHDIAFDVRSPDCGSSVFDPDSAYYNPPPSDPYPNPPVGTTYEATLTGYACDPNQWKFLANQMGGFPAPATIYVEWTDGSYEYVPVDKSTPATVAMYLTPEHLDVTVERAVIVLPVTWKGQFKIASGPCDAVEAIPEPDPIHEPTSFGEFTVQEAGTHVIIVSITRDTVTKTTDTVEDLAQEPPTNLNMYCHTDICTMAMAFAAYDVGGGAQNA